MTFTTTYSVCLRKFSRYTQKVNTLQLLVNECDNVLSKTLDTPYRSYFTEKNFLYKVSRINNTTLITLQVRSNIRKGLSLLNIF